MSHIFPVVDWDSSAFTFPELVATVLVWLALAIAALAVLAAVAQVAGAVAVGFRKGRHRS